MSETAMKGQLPEPKGSAHPELFARQSSGLVREIGLKDALAMNMIIVAPAGAYIFMATLLGTLPRTELILPIVVAGLISLCLGLLYGQLTAAMPRSGGDYVFMSRIVHPAVGALVGGAFLVAFCLSIGFGGLFFAQVTFPFFLHAVAEGLGIGALNDFAADIATESGYFIVAVLALLIAAAIAGAGARVATRAIFYGFLLTVIAIAIFVVYFLTTTRAGFIAAYNDASTGRNAYDAVHQAATAKGLPESTSFSDMWLAIPLLIVSYVGFTFAVYPGGEIKRAGTTVLRAVIGSLIVALIVLLAMWLTLKHLAGFDFLRSAAYLGVVDPEGYGQLSPVVVQGQELWLLISKDPVSKLLCGIGFGLAALIQMVAYLFVCSRLLFAMSFDRLLPTSLADVSKRTHSPIKAILLSAVLALPLIYLGSYTTALTDIARNTILIFLIAFWLTSGGGMLFPYLRKDLYDASPKLLGKSWLGLPPVTVVGFMSFAALTVMIIVTATHDQVSAGFTTISITALAVTFALGPVVYAISRLHSKRTGIDLGLAMTELPPE
jgi:amino acid transporter